VDILFSDANFTLCSFQQWTLAAKTVLKWNDHCIFLLWDMLLIAIHYLDPLSIEKQDKDSYLVDAESLITFLILHISDPSPIKTGISANFDSVWPLNSEGEVYPSSPIASPSSPIRESRVPRALSPIGSPRSPRNSPSQTNSPKRMSAGSPRTARISSQHLHAVRQKIPVILRILSWGYSSDIDGNIDEIIMEDLVKIENVTPTFKVQKKIADFLGLVICGGYSRDQAVGVCLRINF
jgi:hypothetical protein